PAVRVLAPEHGEGAARVALEVRRPLPALAGVDEDPAVVGEAVPDHRLVRGAALADAGEAGGGGVLPERSELRRQRRRRDISVGHPAMVRGATIRGVRRLSRGAPRPRRGRPGGSRAARAGTTRWDRRRTTAGRRS